MLTLGTVAAAGAAPGPKVSHDPERHSITIADDTRSLVLRVKYHQGCFLDQVLVAGRNVVATNAGSWTGVKCREQWITTRHQTTTPSVFTTPNTATISNILCAGAGIAFREAWKFTARHDRIQWRIDREYLTAGRVQDISLPSWNFTQMSTWTGALLGHGGVAWSKLFKQPNSTYGVHAGPVTLWNRNEPVCLRVIPHSPDNWHIATRFSRQPDGPFTLSHTFTERQLTPAHGQSRFLPNRQDVWESWTVHPGVVSVEVTLQTLDLEETYGRGHFPHFNGTSIREILNTIARIGAIDDQIMGSNGYYSGFAVLHEPWIAQLGLAIDDAAYSHAFARTLDHQRDHALAPGGRVKSRWSYNAGDAMPGTYDSHGYYECQWGLLMDSQTSYPINVAELFDLTGDREWLLRHKTTAENALAFLLRRDADGDGLVEMETASHTAAKGSDWIDVIWASHENAFVNAQLYHALTLWANLERLLGDPHRARDYQERAARLKTRFNTSTADGGLWNDAAQSFVHWRDKDDSIHGENLVVPVNFMAVAYGLCSSAHRAQAVLDQVEKRMLHEGLFFWPICFDSYKEGEGAAWQFPFPNYENGDIFLAWGETGTRAYAAHNPAVAVKYINNVLQQYEHDGLAFQRYLRTTQSGAGDDILANNCSPVVGLYRNIYGIQPKWNRLYLEPHLIPELNGTVLKYWLRGQSYVINLSVQDYRITVPGCTFRSHGPFSLATDDTEVRYFHAQSPWPSLIIPRHEGVALEVSVQSWSNQPHDPRRWTILGEPHAGEIEQTLCSLAPHTGFRLRAGPSPVRLLQSDSHGQLILRHQLPGNRPALFELSPIQQND